ncbi:MAG: A/G-specific adenine glycosylase, partial [Pseudobdellovibrio sp.]
KNKATPFLPEMLFPPSLAEKTKKKPEKFDIKHSVTKYDIYIQLNHNTLKGVKLSKTNWFDINTIKKINHSSLMTKILKKLEQLDKL